MAYYDSSKMRNGASEILAELKNYTAAKESIDNIVNTLRNNWEDENHTAYAQKYNSEAKVSAENVQQLMTEYAQLLESSADSWDKVYKSAGSDING